MMPQKDIFDRYLLDLRATPFEEKTEHTDRAALQDLLQAVADVGGAHGVRVHHEPKRVLGKGAPDFKVTKGGLILGYVENKAIGENLDRVLKSDQIIRYQSLSQNIVITDYLHFVWINKNGIQRETLCHATDLESPRFRLREDRLRLSRSCCKGSFLPRPKGSDARSSSHWLSPRAASYCATTLARNSYGKSENTAKGGSSGFLKSFETKSSMD
jgi:hypothetical protein